MEMVVVVLLQISVQVALELNEVLISTIMNESARGELIINHAVLTSWLTWCKFLVAVVFAVEVAGADVVVVCNSCHGIGSPRFAPISVTPARLVTPSSASTVGDVR